MRIDQARRLYRTAQPPLRCRCVARAQEGERTAARGDQILHGTAAGGLIVFQAWDAFAADMLRSRYSDEEFKGYVKAAAAAARFWLCFQK